MKLVIDISEEEYELVRHGNKSYTTELELMNAVANGTPLPKGHGRLIDESKITKCEQIGVIIKDGNIIRCLKTDAPTIIEPL